MSPMRPWRLASALAVLVLVCAVAPAIAAPANLLLNPGLEDTAPGEVWMPAGWDTSESGLETVFFGRDTLLAHGGRWAASLANVSDLHPMAHNWHQRVVVGPEAWGKEAVFSVWTKSLGLDGRAHVLLQAYRDTISKMAHEWGVHREEAQRRLNIRAVDDPLVALGWRRETFTAPETDWVRREVRVFIPPSTNVLFVRIGLIGTGQVLFDDASLTLERARAPRPPKRGENLLADPGFEGDLHAWEFSLPPYEGYRIVRDSSVAQAGRASARLVTGRTEMLRVNATLVQAVDARALQGQRVRLTAWIRTDSLRGEAYTLMFAQTVRGAVRPAQPQQFSLTNDWTRTVLEMDVPKDTYVVSAWCTYTPYGTGDLWWDEVKLEVLGPSKDPDALFKRAP